MSDSDSPHKESILRIMDDFLAHLNQTKKLFMILIFASFIIAPLSLVMAVFILTPQFASQAGQPYEVGVSFTGVSAPFPPQGIVELNESDLAMGNFTASIAPLPPDFVPPQGNVIIIEKGEMHKAGNNTTWIVQKPAVSLSYVPANQMPPDTFFVAPPPQPRFMYISEVGRLDQQTDVTTLVIVVVAVSAALAAAWLVIGVKEFKFFSKWNARYSSYKKLQDDLDKDLQD
jgi:hypothetical protein